MDGRVQRPVIKYLQEKFKADCVDVITEPGPNLILAEQKDENLIKSILDRVNISLEKHNSVGIAVVGHYDCAGNPADKAKQDIHTKKALSFLKQKHQNIELIGLWVNQAWQVEELI